MSLFRLGLYFVFGRRFSFTVRGFVLRGVWELMSLCRWKFVVRFSGDYISIWIGRVGEVGRVTVFGFRSRIDKFVCFFVVGSVLGFDFAFLVDRFFKV